MKSSRIKNLFLSAILSLPMMGFGQAYAPDYLTIPDFTMEQQICFALYTVHNNTLKLTAQLNPLKKSSDLLDIRLQIKRIQVG